MKKAVITGERQAGLVEVPDPQPMSNWALVKIHVAPMCTEYKAFLAGQPRDQLGHEAAGEVVAVAQPSQVQPGDRVVVMPQYPCGVCPSCVSGDYIYCEHGPGFTQHTGSPEGRATMAQYILKPDWLLPRIPDGVSYELASLACCGLGPTMGACERMGVGAFDTVLITGVGPVGLGGVINATYRGARVLVVDGIAYRRELAEQLGAEAALDPADPDILDRLRDLTDGRGVDKAIDCSGTVQAQRLCIDVVRRGGQVTFVGECSDPLSIRVSPDMIRKGISLHGSWHYNLSLYPKIMDVIQNSPVIDQLVSHTYPMSEIQDAMETCALHHCAKVLLYPWE
jgi:threonine dehydrogenase-like Zn-dependent dehydrogenase